MTAFVRHDVPQMIVLLFEISIHHGLGQNEDVRVEDFSRQWSLWIYDVDAKSPEVTH